ncbi:alpha/beta fold hydrolase [Yersinia canariae]|uniref:Alpha/beta fold hydrolase n=1 Tax=Yersinia canariae TaxID=2607663 RepID=A0A857F053_9GAMM|nr:alpha/beta fold hydrolase [Yersinia canariae]QHB33073.1 alpha/beta fold hydrolase [Yersinia canariae]
MKFLFEDESFSFETLRTAGFANYGGAELGEVIVTAQAIPEGDEDAWLTQWEATAERVARIGETSLAAGHRVSAREAFFRASNYYRTAEFFRREFPQRDSNVARLSQRSTQTFIQAAQLLETPFERVEIPYEGTILEGYLFLADASGGSRPTIIYNNGFDSTQEESWFAIGAAAVRRGYNVLAFDGPGQGAALRNNNLVFRHDWENVISPVIDFALTRKEVAPDKISLFGYSLGGYLVARAAAFDHRPAAIILNDGILDFHAAFERMLPPFVLSWIHEQKDDQANTVLQLLMNNKTDARWAIRNGLWTFGASTPAEFVRMTRQYTLEGIVERINAATLVLDAENDQFLKGQPKAVHAVLTSPKQLVTLTSAEGAGEHCHMGAMYRVHQVIFDWLDESLAHSRQ